MKLQKFKTYQQKLANFTPTWYLIDAQAVVLGRLATAAARLLIGKHHATYTPHLPHSDWVIIINSDQVKLTGRKETDKKYYRHSGYIGNLIQKTAQQQRAQDSTKLIYMAVKGMLPKNKLQSLRLNHLKVYPQATHLHTAQQPQVYTLTPWTKSEAK